MPFNSLLVPARHSCLQLQVRLFCTLWYSVAWLPLPEQDLSKVAPGAPEYISHVSDSLRGVVMRLCPGRRRSSSAWISSLLIGRRGGTPSTTQPTPLPCDSPNVDTRNSVPNVLPVACTTSRLALQGICCALWTRHCRLWPLGSRALGPITCCARAWLATAAARQTQPCCFFLTFPSFFLCAPRERLTLSHSLARKLGFGRCNRA